MHAKNTVRTHDEFQEAGIIYNYPYPGDDLIPALLGARLGRDIIKLIDALFLFYNS